MCSSVVFSSKVGREKKKESGDKSVNGICGCGLPVRCCQPAVAGGFIYAYIRSELNTVLAPQALITQSSLVHEPLLQAFPFPSTLGEVTLHLLSQACVLFTDHVGSGSSPLSWGVFLPPLLVQAFLLLIAGQCCCSCQLACLFTAHMGGGSSPLSCGVFLPLLLSQAFLFLVAEGAPAPARASLARPGLFIYSSGKDSPTPLSAQAPHLLCLFVFIVLIVYYSVSLFSPGGGWSVQGAMLIWPRVVCGSTMYCLAHLVRVFPNHLGVGVWWPRGPSGFSV
jgi:hypothetical protein